MTDLDVLQRLQEIFGGPIYSVKKQKAHHKESWRWCILGAEAAHAIEQMLPYFLHRRASKAREALNNYKQGPRRIAAEAWRAKICEAKRLRQTGLTHLAIAQKLHLDRSTISYALQGKYD